MMGRGLSEPDAANRGRPKPLEDAVLQGQNPEERLHLLVNMTQGLAEIRAHDKSLNEKRTDS